ncbi:MAG TPA: hypothetical protein VF054_09725 [Micromonosporaceae bacterium]
MSLPVAVSLAGVVALGVPLLNPSPPVSVVPVLTSQPFGAAPGRRVTHTITLSGGGTGTAPAVRVTFTTTVDLDNLATSARPGRCTHTARSVVCDLGDLRFPAATPPTITITGTIHSPTESGALVENKVAVQVAGSTTADQVVSNAYLVASPTPGTPSTPTPRAAARRPADRTPVLAGAVAAVLVAAGALGFLRLRARRS